MCLNLNLYILNGRIGTVSEVGDLTCKNASVVDFMVGSTKLLDRCLDFRVRNTFHDMEPLFSDTHRPIQGIICRQNQNCIQRTVVKSRDKTFPNQSMTRQMQAAPMHPKWNPTVAENYVIYLDKTGLTNTGIDIDNLLINGPLNKTNIETVVSKTENIFTKAAITAEAISNPVRTKKLRIKHTINKTRKRFSEKT